MQSEKFSCSPYHHDLSLSSCVFVCVMCDLLKCVPQEVVRQLGSSKRATRKGAYTTKKKPRKRFSCEANP